MEGTNRTQQHKSYKFFNEIKKFIDIKKVLKKLNIDFEERNNYLYFVCNYHNDSNPSLSINIDKNNRSYGLFQCWSCSVKGNFIDLIADIKKQSIESIYKLLESDKKIIDIDEENIDILPNCKFQNNTEKHIILPKDFEYIEYDNKFYKYLKNRNLSDKVIEEFNIGYCKEGYYKNRIIIPIYFNKELKSFVARIIWSSKYLDKINNNLSSKEKIKKILYPSGCHIEKILYPDITCVNNFDIAIVVEGVLDVLRLVSLGYKNVFTCFSNKMSQNQVYYLSKFKKIIFIPDADQGGEFFINKIQEFSAHFNAYLYNLPTGEDPNSVNDKYLKNIYIDCYPLKKQYKKIKPIKIKESNTNYNTDIL